MLLGIFFGMNLMQLNISLWNQSGKRKIGYAFKQCNFKVGLIKTLGCFHATYWKPTKMQKCGLVYIQKSFVYSIPTTSHCSMHLLIQLALIYIIWFWILNRQICPPKFGGLWLIISFISPTLPAMFSIHSQIYFNLVFAVFIVSYFCCSEF